MTNPNPTATEILTAIAAELGIDLETARASEDLTAIANLERQRRVMAAKGDPAAARFAGTIEATLAALPLEQAAGARRALRLLAE